MIGAQAEELYAKTLRDYAILLETGEYLSLRQYCKLHRVYERGLRYWMKKNSIEQPGKGSVATFRNTVPDKLSPQTQVVPLHIQAPVRFSNQNSIQGNNDLLKDVSITVQSGMLVSIPRISCACLAELLQNWNHKES